MDIWAKLAVNLAVVGLFVSLWVHLGQALVHRNRVLRDSLFGTTMGLATIASMLIAVPLQDGVFFDLRSSLMAVAALFGGPIAMIPALLLAGGTRLLLGGAGTVPGLMTLGLASLIGLAGYLWSSRRPRIRHIAVVSLGSGISVLLFIFALPSDVANHAFETFALPVSVLTGALTASGSLLIVHAGKVVAMRDLLYAALVQAPDFQYVKDRAGRFVAVNENVVRHHGRKEASELIGKSDGDLESPDRAKMLVDLESEVLDQGKPLLNFEERIAIDGADRWYKSSKVPLRNHDGDIIGLTGVTRDITRRKRLEEELRQSRDTMAFVTAHMSDGLAMFDSDGTLVFCNDQYRTAFPLTAAVRLPGTNLRKILQAVVDTGEQVNVPADRPDDWIELVMASLRHDSEEQIELHDGRWLYLRTRPAEDGSALVVVSDVTSIKRSEQELQRLTGELQTLAATDGMTGLLNRRSFDAALARGVGRANEQAKPICLLMIDVDKFKGFNDRYGHPAGDECLKQVAACLKATVRRADDVVARYGGEEFVAILPDTDEAQAIAVAERFRRNVRALDIPNAASTEGYVTVSIGVACTSAAVGPWNSGHFITRADEALYEAKGAGRNRTEAWRSQTGHGDRAMA